MNTTTPNSTSTSEKTSSKKVKGPIRTEVFVPLLIVIALFAIYFKLFFDSNLRWAFEKIGYEVVGAEVDIEKVETNFIQGTFKAQGIAITNPEKPTHNMLEIGDIHFAVLWDGLLRAKVIVDDMSVEQIAIDTTRKVAGKVKPPEAPKSKGNGQALKEAEQAGQTAVNAAGAQNKDNLFGDIANILGGKGGNISDAELKEIQNNLPSKLKLDAFQKDLQEKSAKWNERLKTLPQGPEIDALGQRLSKIKTGNFKSPQEALDSIKQFTDIVNEANTKYQAVSQISGDLGKDLNNANEQLKSINDQIKVDVAGLENKFHLPHLDSKSLTQAILNQYIQKYLAKLGRFRSMAEKALPPAVTGKPTEKNASSAGSTAAKPDMSLQPRPRARGVSYEFGKPHSYPAFWVKHIGISSQPTAGTNYGDVKGEVLDVTSNQVLTEKPTVLDFNANFPTLDVNGAHGKVSVDNRTAISLLTFAFGVDAYKIEGKELVSSPDAKIAFKQAQAQLQTNGTLTAYENLDFKLSSQIQKVDYDISASNSAVEQILKGVFTGLPTIGIQASGHGVLPDVPLDIESNIGSELQKGFEKQINAKVAEVKAKLQAAINAVIGPEQKQVEGQLGQIRGQIDGQLKKTTEALNKQKDTATKDMNQSQKGSPQQLQQTGQKALDDLKKSLGL